jgi:hypothetical protein
MNPIITRITDPIAEEATVVMTGVLRDEDNEGFKPATLTLTLYDAPTLTILNSRNKQNILDANGGEVTFDGEFTFEFSPNDNVIVGNRKEERHVALFEWSWEVGSRKGKHEVHFTVRNFDKVP